MAEIDRVSVARALISVSDKTGLVEFAQALVAMGVEILSTGGPAKTLADAGIAVDEVTERTGFPELMAGRVQTRHPTIHGRRLGRRDLPRIVCSNQEPRISPLHLLEF